jgi:hypothetical protein
MTDTEIAIQFYKESRMQNNPDMILRAQNDLERLGIKPPCFYIFNFHTFTEKDHEYSHSYYSWMKDEAEATTYANSFTHIYQIEYYETSPKEYLQNVPY